MSKTDQMLAIIVPAYSSQYLAAALESIVSQTDQRFNLYVFDDASPHPIAKVVSEFGSKRPILFHRFEENLGGKSLVAHFHRCIARTTEPWICVFSDDDLMDPACVASFLNELINSSGNHDLYRFNTRSIDVVGRVMSESEPHPALETGGDFLCARLQDRRTSTMQELVFARETYLKVGGIPDFPLAWASDDAFIARMGAQQPIKTISGPRVSWRQSGVSISTNLSPANAKQKIIASQMLVNWAADFLGKHPPSGRPLSTTDVHSLTSGWFFRRVYFTHVGLSLKTSLEINRFAGTAWDWPWGRGLIKCMRLNQPFIKNRLLKRIVGLVLSTTPSKTDR